MTTRRSMTAAVLATATLAMAPPSLQAQIPDPPGDLVRINESTLNELVDATLPVGIAGTAPVTREVCFIWCTTVTLCEGRWRATIEEMTLDIRPTGIDVDGSATGTYQCRGGIGFDTEIDASAGRVRYEAADNSLRLVVPASIRPCFATPFGRICASRQQVDLSIPTVYLRMAKLSFETPDGESYVAMTASGIDVTMTDDYLELEGDVSAW